jgi:hypothetical protein
MVKDGDSVRPGDVVILTAVEQTAGLASRRESYEEGKV